MENNIINNLTKKVLSGGGKFSGRFINKDTNISNHSENIAIRDRTESDGDSREGKEMVMK